MEKSFKPLMDIDFGKIVSEGAVNAKTTTGKELFEKYSGYMMNNSANCSVVNNFIKEANNYRYDSAIVEALDTISNTINENKFSWKLATAVEVVESNNSRYNSINRNACSQVRSLLENKEEDEVVRYVKSGALKNVMFVESLRQVVKQIYNDNASIIETSNFKISTPVSYTELKDDTLYFLSENRLFSINKEKELLEHAQPKSIGLSENFWFINSIINRGELTSDESYRFLIESKNVEYIVKEQGKVTKISEGKEVELTVDEMRENNRIFCSVMLPKQKMQLSEALEGIARLSESFDNVMQLDNVKFITTAQGKNLSICEGENAINVTLYPNAIVTGARVYGQSITKTFDKIHEAVDFVKQNTKVDLTNIYSDRIVKEAEESQYGDIENAKKAIQESAMAERRAKVEALTEKYKNDPAMLMVLSKIATELNALM